MNVGEGLLIFGACTSTVLCELGIRIRVCFYMNGRPIGEFIEEKGIAELHTIECTAFNDDAIGITKKEFFVDKGIF